MSTRYRLIGILICIIGVLAVMGGLVSVAGGNLIGLLWIIAGVWDVWITRKVWDSVRR